MEYLDINLTEDSSLFLHAIHCPLFWRILKKNRTLLWKDSSLCPEILTKNVVQEFHLRTWKRDAAESIYWRHSTSPTFFFYSLIKIEMGRPSNVSVSFLKGHLQYTVNLFCYES